jgi:hypothetical protein
VLPEGALRPGAALVIRQYGTWLAFSLVAVLINSVSGVADAARAGSATPAWHHFAWELTSWFAYATFTPAVFWLDNAAAARRARPLVRLLGYVGFSFIFSGLHVALMIGSRPAVFALLGDHYEIGSWAGRFAYEYPKDIVAYLIVLGIAVFWRRSVLAEAASVATPAAPSFLVREAAGETLLKLSRHPRERRTRPLEPVAQVGGSCSVAERRRPGLKAEAPTRHRIGSFSPRISATRGVRLSQPEPFAANDARR